MASELGLVFLLNDDKSIEIVKIRSKQEVSNKFKRKKKRVLGKIDDTETQEVFENKDDYMNNLSNWIEAVRSVKLKQKANSIFYI